MKRGKKMKNKKITKYFMLIKQNLSLALPLCTVLWFSIFYLITGNLTISSIAGILIGFCGTILVTLNLE